MKRNFGTIDESIPDEAWKHHASERLRIQKSANLEYKADLMLDHRLRSVFGRNSEANVVVKHLRIFIRHQFVPKFAQEKDHFLLTIEGHLLDPKYRALVPFSSIFKHVTVQVDRRGGHTEQYQWPLLPEQVAADSAAAAEGDGASSSGQDVAPSVHAFRCKITNNDNNKPINARLSFERALNTLPVATRYEVSDAFLAVFPHILLLQNKSVSEEEVLFALWYYCQVNGLLDTKDKRVVRCDPALCKLFGIEYIPPAAPPAVVPGATTSISAAVSAPTGSGSVVMLNSFRTRLLDAKLLVPIVNTAPVASPVSAATSASPAPGASPVPAAAATPAIPVLPSGARFDLEYLLTTSYSTAVDITKDNCCCPESFMKSGGKCFDIEVLLPSSVLNAAQLDSIAVLNNTTGRVLARQADKKLEECYQQCNFIRKQILRATNELREVQRRQETLLLRDAVLREHMVDDFNSQTQTQNQHIQGQMPAGGGAEMDADAALVEWMHSCADASRGMRSAANTVEENDDLTPLLPPPVDLLHGAGSGSASILHSLQAFLDIGNDAQFAALQQRKTEKKKKIER